MKLQIHFEKDIEKCITDFMREKNPKNIDALNFIILNKFKNTAKKLMKKEFEILSRKLNTGTKL